MVIWSTLDIGVWKEKLTADHFHLPATVFNTNTNSGRQLLGLGTSQTQVIHAVPIVGIVYIPLTRKFPILKSADRPVQVQWHLHIIIPLLYPGLALVDLVSSTSKQFAIVKIYGYDHVIGMLSGASIGQACLLKPISWHTIGMYANAKIPT